MSAYEPNSRHLWEFLIFCFNMKKSVAEAYRMLSNTYGEAAISERTCREWFQRFKNGDFDVEDQHGICSMFGLDILYPPTPYLKVTLNTPDERSDGGVTSGSEFASRLEVFSGRRKREKSPENCRGPAFKADRTTWKRIRYGFITIKSTTLIGLHCPRKNTTLPAIRTATAGSDVVQSGRPIFDDFFPTILFSDKAHFWFNGYVNKQICRISSEANPQMYVEIPLHPEKLTVCCALWAGGILLQKR
ncbi:mariner Mos1 transposase [Trichonephila clavipes]|nr:mariner Mos1 transposase [Trichonephila clavipes]